MAWPYDDESTGPYGSVSQVPPGEWFGVDPTTGTWQRPGQPTLGAVSGADLGLGLDLTTAWPRAGQGYGVQAPGTPSLGQVTGLGAPPRATPSALPRPAAREPLSAFLPPQPSMWESMARGVGMATPQGREILQGYDQQRQQGLTNRLALRREQRLEEQETRQATSEDYNTLLKIAQNKSKSLRNALFDRWTAEKQAAGAPVPQDIVDAFKKSGLDEGVQIATMFEPMIKASGLDMNAARQYLQEGGDIKGLVDMLDLRTKQQKLLDDREEEARITQQRAQYGAGTLGQVSGAQVPASAGAVDQRPRGYVERGTTQPLIGSEQLTPSFTAKVTEVATRLGMNPQDLLRIISFETGGTFNPAERNRARSGATGLIQFTKATAKALGTTTDALAKMSPDEQLDYVEKYLTPYKGKLGNLKDAYLAVLKPAALGQGLDAPLFTKDKDGLAYTQNAGLDTGGKGHVTVGDALAAVMRTTTGGGTPAPAPDTRNLVAGPGAPGADQAQLQALNNRIQLADTLINQNMGSGRERTKGWVNELQQERTRLIAERKELLEPVRLEERKRLEEPYELRKAEASKALTPISDVTQKSLATNKSIYRSIGKIEDYLREGTDLPADFVNLVAQDAPGIAAWLQSDPKNITGLAKQWETKFKAVAANDPRANRFLSALGNMRDLVIRERSGGSVTGNELDRAMGAFMGSLPNINQAFGLFAQNLANVKETVMDELVTSGAAARPLSGGKAMYGTLPKEIRDRIDYAERGEDYPKARMPVAASQPRPQVTGPIKQVAP